MLIYIYIYIYSYWRVQPSVLVKICTSTTTSSIAKKGVCLYTSPEIAPTPTHQSSHRETHRWPILNQIGRRTHPLGEWDGGGGTSRSLLICPLVMSLNAFSLVLNWTFTALLSSRASAEDKRTVALLPRMKTRRESAFSRISSWVWQICAWEEYGCYSHV